MSELRVIEDFLPEELATQIERALANVPWYHGWRSNHNLGYGHWNHTIASGASWNSRDISDLIPEPFSTAWRVILEKYLPGYALIRCYANAHTYGVEGYPHGDSWRSEDLTVVLYVNREWKREWAGETVIFEKDSIAVSALPKFNRAVIFPGSMLHAARSVSRICPQLRRTLMFKVTPIGIDPARDRLQTFLESIGAAEKRHRDGALIGHLLGTYDLLRAAGQPERVCLAGGSHSVLGTSIYKDACIGPDQIQHLFEAIGPEAANLAVLFSMADRRVDTLEASEIGQPMVLTLLDGRQSHVDSNAASDLRFIEAANLYDQRALSDKLPNLKSLWSSVFTER